MNTWGDLWLNLGLKMFKIVPSHTYERLQIKNKTLKNIVFILAEALLAYGKHDPKIKPRVDEILKLVKES